MTVPLAVPTVPQDDAAAGVVLEPLTPARIRHSIDTVCGRANLEQDCWKFRRASNSDLVQARRQTRSEKAEAAAGERQGTPPSQLLYGLVATPASTVASEEATTASASNSLPPPSPHTTNVTHTLFREAPHTPQTQPENENENNIIEIFTTFPAKKDKTGSVIFRGTTK